jgi:hypothetical protein
MNRKSTGDQFSEQESQRRLEAALRGAGLVGTKPQSEMKLGKPRAKPKTPRRKAKEPAGEPALGE